MIDEVIEAIKVTKRVTEMLRAGGVIANYIEDNVSKDKQRNLVWLVNEHNQTLVN